MLAAHALEEIEWLWLSLDGALTKAPLVREKTGPNPTDRGEGEAERSLLTNAHGILLVLPIEGANRHDMKLLAPALACVATAPAMADGGSAAGLCLDKEYDFEEVRALVAEFGFTAHIRACGEEPAHPERKPIFSPNDGWMSVLEGE